MAALAGFGALVFVVFFAALAGLALLGLVALATALLISAAFFFSARSAVTTSWAATRVEPLGAHPPGK